MCILIILDLRGFDMKVLGDILDAIGARLVLFVLGLFFSVTALVSPRVAIEGLDAVKVVRKKSGGA